MSAGTRVPLADAAAIAEQLVELLRPDCARIEIAGSVRRRREDVGDIEIVAIPHFAQEVRSVGLFGDEEIVTHNLLDQGLRVLLALADCYPSRVRSHLLERRQVEAHRKDGRVDLVTRDGEAYKALVYGGLPVDLFITDAERWGVIFALRTGPGDLNQRLVTDCQRYFRRVEGGRILHFGKPVPCPEEEDFFAAIGQPWVDPWLRSVERVAIGAPA